MADPYATSTPDLSGRPDGPPLWQLDVERLGGGLIGPDGVLGEDSLEFAVVSCRGIGTLAPFAALDPAMAVLLWIEHVAAPREATAANALLRTLEDFPGRILAIKQGSVGGPDDRPGCSSITAELIAGLLAARSEISWEQDPDFAYEVPSSAPGISEPEARALLPRLLYADNDRVYEHAGLVAEKKRERHQIAVAVSGLDPTVIAVAGWPPEATSGDWRD